MLYTQVPTNSMLEWSSDLLFVVSVVDLLFVVSVVDLLFVVSVEAFDCFHQPVIENTVNNRL